MNKVLSISIAAYNASAFLDTSLESIVNSDVLDDVQVIIVNDGSKDNTKEKGSEWAEKYPNSITLINKANGGYGSTINSAIEVAVGKYFKLLDADDCYDSKELSKLVNFLKDAKEDLVITDYYRCEGALDNRCFVKTLDLNYNQSLPINVLPSIDIMHALVVKTDILKANKTEFGISEHCFYTDLEFCVKSILSSKNFIYKDYIVYCYLVGREGQSVSLQGRIKHIDNHDHIVRLVTDKLLAAPNDYLCRKNIPNLIVGHILYYSLCMKATCKNLKTFIEFRNFVNTKVSYKEPEYKKVRKFLKHPKLFYLPSCFKNRTYYFLRKLIKGKNA